MYISIGQVAKSLDSLADLNPFFGMSFLAFKKANIPIGRTTNINFTQATNAILNKHYKLSPDYSGYYNPFLTSKKDDRWVRSRYASTTLQRITKNTFADCLIHPSGSSEWGWTYDYIEKLRKHLSNVGGKIPAFDLAVWLFRDEVWPDDATQLDVIYKLLDDFSFSEDEISGLFDISWQEITENWISDTYLTEVDIQNMVGAPSDAAPAESAALDSLELTEIGPATYFLYEPADRLNIITGDNSLGKTFILDAIWWSLTGQWIQNPLTPRPNVEKRAPRIEFTISALEGKSQHVDARFDWDIQEWQLPKKRTVVAGLVIYARYDGSFAIWEPAYNSFYKERLPPSGIYSIGIQQRVVTPFVILKPNDLWYGLPVEGMRDWITNGMLRDWVTWQTSGVRYNERWEAFVECLHALSPEHERLIPGEPTKLRFNELEIPTVKMPYGDVPIIHASAGVQRAIALAYVLVWAWFRHEDNSAMARREPEQRLVLLVDEVEAHLHPRWQRVIVPSLMNVIKKLAPKVFPQIHLATHSPMVMASAETVFDEECDNLFHLRSLGQEVLLEELPFIKRGRADLWLMSDVFGLTHARSAPAERAIEDAKALQLSDNDVDSKQVLEANKRLIQYLAQDDDFWSRWRFFAKQHGVD